MTVKELIEALQKMPQGAEVEMYSSVEIYEESSGYTSELYRAIGSVEMGDGSSYRWEAGKCYLLEADY